MLGLLAVLSQQVMSLQLRRLAGSPGRCLAGWHHASAECTARLCHSSRHIHHRGVASARLHHSIPAPVWMNTAYPLHSLTFCLTIELLSHHPEAVSQAAVASLSAYRKWKQRQIIRFLNYLVFAHIKRFSRCKIGGEQKNEIWSS